MRHLVSRFAHSSPDIFLEHSRFLPPFNADGGDITSRLTYLLHPYYILPLGYGTDLGKEYDPFLFQVLDT